LLSFYQNKICYRNKKKKLHSQLTFALILCNFGGYPLFKRNSSLNLSCIKVIWKQRNSWFFNSKNQCLNHFITRIKLSQRCLKALKANSFYDLNSCCCNLSVCLGYDTTVYFLNEVTTLLDVSFYASCFDFLSVVHWPYLRHTLCLNEFNRLLL